MVELPRLLLTAPETAKVNEFPPVKIRFGDIGKCGTLYCDMTGLWGETSVKRSNSTSRKRTPRTQWWPLLISIDHWTVSAISI